MITCLLCRREFHLLSTHLRKAHGTDVASYRHDFHIPAGVPLASEDYRAVHREKMRQMQADGRASYNHLPQASATAAKMSRKFTPEELELRAARMREVGRGNIRLVGPDAKRADGENAEHNRKRQRAAYAARKAK